ncbi:MAG: ParB/RepB/Spo0J family partition protein [Leptospirales bacterium]|nr:ParB/RepB/Spo0J family partition protein [Leptospirales bacterium]
MTKKALGKGLGAIISTSQATIDDIESGLISDKNRIRDIDISKVIPNPDQPRKFFDENEILGLAASIKHNGQMSPIHVREKEGLFVLISGERRLRACKRNGMKKIKCVVIDVDDEKAFTMSLIENIQRENLNPIEEAKAYKLMIDRFKLKQQDVAQNVGKDRTTITNSMRLLNLPEEIQNGILEKKISAGHAKVLLSLAESSAQLSYYNDIIQNDLSVRSLESLIAGEKGNSAGRSNTQRSVQKKSAQIKKMEEMLISKLGTKVEIRHSGNKGKIEISYYSLDDFERIVDKIK